MVFFVSCSASMVGVRANAEAAAALIAPSATVPRNARRLLSELLVDSLMGDLGEGEDSRPALRCAQ